MAFHLLKFQTDFCFFKVKSTQFTQLFLAVLDRFIELFHELFIAPRNSTGIPMIFEDNDSFSRFRCATAHSGSGKSLTGLLREARNEPVCFPLDKYLCLSAGNTVKTSKVCYSEEKIPCCRVVVGGLLCLILTFSKLTKPYLPKQTKRSSEHRKEQQGANCY